MGNKKRPQQRRGRKGREKEEECNRQSYARGNEVVPRPLFSPPQNEPWS